MEVDLIIRNVEIGGRIINFAWRALSQAEVLWGSSALKVGYGESHTDGDHDKNSDYR